MAANVSTCLAQVFLFQEGLRGGGLGATSVSNTLAIQFRPTHSHMESQDSGTHLKFNNGDYNSDRSLKVTG